MTGRLIWIVACEPSGDILGARLMRALRRRLGDTTRFAGIGGPRMAEEGMLSLFPMHELTLMGFAEVIPHIPRVLRRLRETEAAIRGSSPDVVVTIDSPGFNLRLLERIRDLAAPKVQYVGPQAWAWKPKRAARLALLVDRVLLILPFEPAFFDGYGVKSTYVGHPVVEEIPASLDPDGVRAALGIGPAQRILCLLPGSRASEVSRLLPVLGEAAEQIVAKYPDMVPVIPTVPVVAAMVREAVAKWSVQPRLFEDRARRFDLYAASEVSIAASGTVGLELALANLPFVLVYRVSFLTGLIVRRLVRIPFASLVNLILSREAVVELIQEDLTTDRLVAETLRLIEDPIARAAQKSDLHAVATALCDPPDPSPSDRAAAAIADLLGPRPDGVSPAT